MELQERKKPLLQFFFHIRLLSDKIGKLLFFDSQLLFKSGHSDNGQYIISQTFKHKTVLVTHNFVCRYYRSDSCG